jgi:ABC-type glycerol-3-phosphate transport system substrate-binding protein
MKLRIAVVAALCVGLVCGIAVTQGYAQAAKVTVYNPMGTPPPIPMKAMAPRLDKIDGKTIFLVSTGFPNSQEFLEVMADWFKDNHPTVKTEIRSGSFANLRNEISEKADVVFLGVGH